MRYPSRLSKSLPFASSVANPGPESESSAQPKHVEVTGVCNIDGETPMRFYLRGYFTKLLQKKREKPVGTKSKQKVKPRFYGEALTLDEVAERFAAEEALKSEQKKSKKKRAGCTKVARRKSLSGTQGVKATVKKSRGQNTEEDSAKSSNDDEDAVEEEKCQKCRNGMKMMMKK